MAVCKGHASTSVMIAGRNVLPKCDRFRHSGDFEPISGAIPELQARSNPRIVPVAEANRSVSKPMRWSIETKRLGSG